jgi:hypothetical protein
MPMATHRNDFGISLNRNRALPGRRRIAFTT